MVTCEQTDRHTQLKTLPSRNLGLFRHCILQNNFLENSKSDLHNLTLHHKEPKIVMALVKVLENQNRAGNLPQANLQTSSGVSEEVRPFNFNPLYN